MPHVDVDTQTWLSGSRIDEVWQEHRKMINCRHARQSYQKKKRLERQQAKEVIAGATTPTKQMMGFKRWVATKDQWGGEDWNQAKLVEGGLARSGVPRSPGDSRKEKRRRRMQVVVKKW